MNFQLASELLVCGLIHLLTSQLPLRCLASRLLVWEALVSHTVPQLYLLAVGSLGVALAFPELARGLSGTRMVQRRLPLLPGVPFLKGINKISSIIYFFVNRFGLAVRLVSGRTSVRYRFGSSFSSKRLWFVETVL